MFPHIDTPAGGKLLEADLDNMIALHRGVACWDGKTCPPCKEDCNQGDDCPARQPRAAEAANDEGAEPPLVAERFQHLLTPKTGLVVVLCTGLPLLAVIVWALASWLPST